MGKILWVSVTSLLLLSALTSIACAQAFADARVIAVSAGNYHALALKDDGTVWAWGNNNAGQVGISNTTRQLKTPTQVPISDVVAISAGMGNSFALKEDGTVWAWGRNENGELGDGTTENSFVPVKVEGLNGIKEISTSGNACFALDGSGNVYGWGYNERGCVGDDTYVNRLNPVLILSGISHLGERGSYAIGKDGKVWAWGNNIIRSSSEFNIYGLIGDFSNNSSRPNPFQLPLEDVVEISIGNTHTTFLKKDNTVWAWGSVYYGQMGTGTGTDDFFKIIESPVRADVDHVKKISTIGDHVLALQNDGTVWEWGSYIDGSPQETNRRGILSPAHVNINNIKDISCGDQYCLAIDDYGNVWGWGTDSYGELGKDHNEGLLFNDLKYIRTPQKLITAPQTQDLAITQNPVPSPITKASPAPSTTIRVTITASQKPVHTTGVASDTPQLSP